ncbi:NAD(P)/FAD-dependent oxidoreductase [Roseivirga sp. BDSF3-8]|uniref:protoporphyrinogen/coproporphyrinogen oxidase n=1 Tax=Roseivirga sp. BDSF3-8 TaxID=3241598 RepID=UPI00353268D9
MQKCDVVIVGSGMAGLTAASVLQRNNLSYCIVESSDRAGGRIKTDNLDGFLLDRGFQVLLTAYPETRELLDYAKLNLKSFLPGAQVYRKGKTFRVADPTRQPSELFSSLFSPLGSFTDKFRVLRLRAQLSSKSLLEIFQEEEKPSLIALKEEYGFSDKMIDSFFKPFFSGIFLEGELETSRRALDFVFKMFSEGHAAVPEKGMEQIPKQLAGQLPSHMFHFNTPATSITDGKVVTESGKEFEGKYVLIATQAPALQKLSGFSCKVTYQSTSTFYFVADKPPYIEPILTLNGTGSGLINNVAVMSNIASSYAPEGKHLISASVIGDQAFDEYSILKTIKKELEQMFGKEVTEWEHLHTYHIPYALPAQNHVQHEIAPAMMQISERNYICGDHLLNGSINAAMRSGRLAAELVADRLRA